MDFEFTEAQKMWQKKVRDFAAKEIEPEWFAIDESEKTPMDLARKIGQGGFCKVFASEKFGGVGVSSVMICIGREEFSRVCAKADGIYTMQGLGGYPITVHGSDAQKKKYLPAVLNVQKLISFCLTEPNAGSDVAAMQTSAKLEGDHWVLNGDKCYVANPGDAQWYTVFARTDPELGTRGISAFIVDRDFKGVSFEKMHLNYLDNVGHLIMNDCRVPKENLFGERGKGLRIALGNLDTFRTSVGAATCGMAGRALDDAIAFAKKRIAFGGPIANLQAIQFKLASMATELDAARLLVYRAAWLRDEVMKGREEGGEPARSIIKEASMAKLFATEVANRVVDEAVQIHGGAGLAKGTHVEMLLRAVRQPRIYEGTSEIQRLTIARQLLK